MSRIFVLVCLLPAVFLPTVSAAQQAKKVPRIGFVNTEGSPRAPGPQFEAFRQGLRELGYIEGENIFIELRYPEEKPERTASLVTELVQLKVDLLVLGAQPAIRAAKQATKTIPIVLSRPRIQSRRVLSIAWRTQAEILPGLPDLPES